MTKFKELKVGNILGESQYYLVEKIVGNEVQLKSETGDPIVVSKDYVEKFLLSGDQFESTEEMNKTKLAETFILNSRVPMTVAFLKADTSKAKKAYKEELAAMAETVKNNFMAKGISAIEEALANPVLDYIPGELRIMRGRHYCGHGSDIWA